jgi:hypothetical protein
MGANESVCPHCGYDFPLEADDSNRSCGIHRHGIAYSKLADIALIVGIIAAGFGCMAAILASVGLIVEGRVVEGLVGGPIAFFLQLAMLVVFVRVQKIK